MFNNLQTNRVDPIKLKNINSVDDYCFTTANANTNAKCYPNNKSNSLDNELIKNDIIIKTENHYNHYNNHLDNNYDNQANHSISRVDLNNHYNSIDENYNYLKSFCGEGKGSVLISIKDNIIKDDCEDNINCYNNSNNSNNSNNIGKDDN